MGTTIQDSGVSQTLLDTMNPKKSTSSTSTEDIQNRFMTMLVAQMKNQDPLNPLDNAQVTSQLAQLSTVTGIDKLNSTMQTLMGSYQSSQNLQAASMIGHGVLTAGNGVTLSNSTGILGVNLNSAADSVKVTVVDGSGNEVRSFDLGAQQPGTIPVSWDGKDNSGTAVPDGQYKFNVKAVEDGAAVTSTALQFGIVNSVSIGASGITLDVPNLGNVNFSDVKQIL